ncbi:DUF4190 domain-containing protein [Mycobacterium montefiorense]|uniref:DUF4190 domain-containing protein n=1 Tax=Mycobacterium montefiorense TaxID=154654 RepID=UPI0021DBAED3|nr:DUF4190 domain-containing protein [Mycobacterium montefiorense]MCV7426385.1 DUF4190 domain-containing protein [Mycobacterium montefiorense]GLE53145.1 hypothetical protein ATCCBAA256_27060 [Mycobacterium montefiorense]
MTMGDFDPNKQYNQPRSAPPPPGEFSFPPSNPGSPGGAFSPAGYGHLPAPPSAVGPPRLNNTNRLAIYSLVFSLVGWLCIGLGGAVGAVLGYVALNQIKHTGEGGRAIALAGIIIGIIGFVGIWGAALISR